MPGSFRPVPRAAANQYRDDLREKGVGSGCHGFVARVPEGVALEVRRSQDGMVLKQAQKTAAAGQKRLCA